MRKRLFAIFAGAVLLASSGLTPTRASSSTDRGEETYRLFKIFADVFHLTREYYLEDVDSGILARGAIEGMILSVDRYGSCLTGEAAASAADPVFGAGRPEGMILGIHDGFPAVIHVFPGSSAAKSGVQAGELIISIGEVSTANLTFASLERSLTCDGAKPLHLKFVTHEGERLLERDLGCEAYSVDDQVRMQEPTPGVAVVRLPSLSGAEQVDSLGGVLSAALERDRIKQVIVDLRGNADGPEMLGIKAADLFVKDGELLATLVDPKGNRIESFTASDGHQYQQRKLVLLVDRSTASGAEVLAAVLHARLKAVLIGETTFGKTLRQTRIPLKDGDVMQLAQGTFVVGDEPIHQHGLTPDIALEPEPQTGEDSADRWLARAIDEVQKE